MYNIENNITDPFIKWATAFDPYYLYTLSKSIEGDNSCNEGMYISEAIEFLSTIGSKKWSIAPYLTCSDRWKKDEFFDYAEVHSVPYKTSQEDFGVIPYNNSAQYIQDTKVAISYGVPVVIGVNLTESFRPKSKVNLTDNELVGISSNGLWNPEENEESAGAHAMTIIV